MTIRKLVLVRPRRQVTLESIVSIYVPWSTVEVEPTMVCDRWETVGQYDKDLLTFNTDDHDGDPN